MTNRQLAAAIYRASHLTGRFVLRSGMVSTEYFDKYLFESDPRLLNRITDLLAHKIPKGTEVLAGLEMGGIPIATILSFKTGLPAVFVRKKAKTYGTCKFSEGINIEGKTLCIIEDVVTTGGQIILSAEDLRRAGGKVSHVLCVILRRLAAKNKLKASHLDLDSLFTMAELTKAKRG